MGQLCGKASWESLLGKPRGKATDPLIHAKGSATLLLQLVRKAHVHAQTRDPSGEKGLISPGGENLLNCVDLRQVLLTYNGDIRDPLWWPQERQVPIRVARGPLGIPLPSMPQPKTLCGVGAGSEDSSPVLTWILGYFWSLPRGVSPRLEWGHARALSSRTVAAVSRCPSRGSRDLWLSLEAFPRVFPTRLSHRAVPRATVV